MRADAALCPAAHVVDEAHGGDGDRRRPGDERGRPADERQAQPTVVHALRTEREHELHELASAVAEACEIAPCLAMRERRLDLDHLETGSDRVDRHPHLAAESGGKRKALLARTLRQPALAGERLARLEAHEAAESRARHALRQPEPVSASRRKDGDRDVPPCSEKRLEVAFEVSVAEEQRSRRRLSLGKRQRLALAAPRKPDRPAPRLARPRAPSRPASRRPRRRQAQSGIAPRRAAHRVRDMPLLVPRGDEDRQTVAHPSVDARASTSGSVGGRTPSVAVGFSP